MARKISVSEPALAIEFFLSGFYTYRSQLFAPFKGIGVNVVSFHDPVLDGNNMEDTDLYEWSRRPGFSIFCPVPLSDTEVVNQFYSSRPLNNTVLSWIDTNQRLALFTSTSLTTVISKSTANQGYIETVGNMTYFADGSVADNYKYDGAIVTTWGLAPPTVAPPAIGVGFWQPVTGFALGSTILDPNGNIETITAILSANGTVASPTAFSNAALAGSLSGSWGGSVDAGGEISQTQSTTGYTNYLYLQNFTNPNPLAIPSDATILGVVVRIPKLAAAGAIIDQSVKLVIGGVAGGTDHAVAAAWSESSLVPTPYGSPTDTWGFSLTPAQLNAAGTSGFGVAISANIEATSLFKMVQSGSAYSVYPATSTEYIFPTPVTQGNSILVVITTDGGGEDSGEALLNILDNQGNNYTLANEYVVRAGQFAQYVYLATNVAEGPTSVVVSTEITGSPSTLCSIACHELYGLVTIAGTVVDGTASNPQILSTKTTFNSGSISPTATNFIVFSYGYFFPASGTTISPAMTPGGGYTEAVNTIFNFGIAQRQVATAWNVFVGPPAGLVYSPTWTAASAVMQGLGGTIGLKVQTTPQATAIVGGGAPNAAVVTVYYINASGLGGPGLTGATEPNWTTIVGSITNDGGGLQWTDDGNIETWYPLTNYPIPVVILDPNGNLQLGTTTTVVQPWNAATDYSLIPGTVVSFGGAYWVSVYSGGVPATNVGIAPAAGYSVATAAAGVTTTVVYWAQAQSPILTGSIAPVWNTTLGEFTTDGSYVWTNIGQGSALASFGYAYVYGFRTIYGALTTSSPFSNNTGAILGPLQGSITSFATAGGIATFYGSNNFQPGNVFEVTGLTTTNGLLLNDISYTVLTAVPSAVFPLTNVAVTSHVLTVTAINNLAVGQQVTFSNVASATFLNGLTVTVLSGGLSGTEFTANIAGTATYASAADTGTITIQGSWTAATAIAGTVGQVQDAGVAIPRIAQISGVGSAASTPGAPGLCNSVATITAVSATASIVQFTAANNFQPGIWVTIAGLTNSSNVIFNGQQFQVIAVDKLVGTQNTYFQVYCATPNTSGTILDSGTATFNAIEIYRTSDGGGSYLFDYAITNPGFVPWVYDDFTPDEDLDILLVAPLAHQNDPPPGAPGSTILTAGSIMQYWNGRLWLVVGNYVYFDAGPDCTNGIPEEAWPPGNRFQFAGPPIGLEPNAEGTGLLVILADRVNVILGGPETISFYPTDALSNFGISNPNAIWKDGSTLGLFTTQRQYYEVIGKEKQYIGDHVGDYLSENFTAAATYATMHRDGLDVGAFLSNGVDRILRFGSNIGAWSVPAFPIMGAGALNSIETSVGVFSLMLATPKGGVTSNTGAVNPTVGASVAGGGTPWIIPSESAYASVTFTATGESQILRLSGYRFTIPLGAVVQGIVVQVTGLETTSALSLTITPTNPAAGASSYTVDLSPTVGTATVGGPTNLWGMPWTSPSFVNSGLSFDLIASLEG